MRKFISVLLVSLLVFSVTACGSKKSSQESGEESTGTSVQESSGEDDLLQEENIPDAGQAPESEDGEKDQEGNILKTEISLIAKHITIWLSFMHRLTTPTCR